MTAAENANLLFFTELVGLPVFDLKQRRIGRVRDAAVVPLIHPSRVDRILVGGGTTWLSVRYDQIARISLRGIQLSNEKLYPYHSDEYMLHVQRIRSVTGNLQSHIVDADNFAAVDINNLLVEQIALDAQHVFIGMVRIELLVGKLYPAQGNPGDLIVTDRKPGSAPAHQNAVNPGRVDEGNNGGIANPANAPVFQIEYGQTHQFGEE